MTNEILHCFILILSNDILVRSLLDTRMYCKLIAYTI